MARITCAISGVSFTVEYLESTVIKPSVGYYHPIFTLPQSRLYQLYYQHTRNNLSPTDSYLLFCAFLHITGSIDWQHPATLHPAASPTKKLIQNNLAQLIRVYEKTSLIQHPHFKQPTFVVSYDNCQLAQITNWIEAWEVNLETFNTKLADAITQRSLQEVENRLSTMLTAGIPLDKLPPIVSEWANQAAEFPPLLAESYKKVIRSCFNTSRMFNTPLALIKEVKNYCECNIDAGSIHFHTLHTILCEGISRHVDYLGGSSLALGYTLLPTTLDRKKEELKTEAELAIIIAKAPDTMPIRHMYPDASSYIRARLAYRVALEMAKKEEKETAPPATSN